MAAAAVNSKPTWSLSRQLYSLIVPVLPLWQSQKYFMAIIGEMLYIAGSLAILAGSAALAPNLLIAGFATTAVVSMVVNPLFGQIANYLTPNNIASTPVASNDKTKTVTTLETKVQSPVPSIAVTSQTLTGQVIASTPAASNDTTKTVNTLETKVQSPVPSITVTSQTLTGQTVDKSDSLSSPPAKNLSTIFSAQTPLETSSSPAQNARISQHTPKSSRSAANQTGPDQNTGLVATVTPAKDSATSHSPAGSLSFSATPVIGISSPPFATSPISEHPTPHTRPESKNQAAQTPDQASEQARGLSPAPLLRVFFDSVQGGNLDSSGTFEREDDPEAGKIVRIIATAILEEASGASHTSVADQSRSLAQSFYGLPSPLRAGSGNGIGGAESSEGASSAALSNSELAAGSDDEIVPSEGFAARVRSSSETSAASRRGSS